MRRPYSIRTQRVKGAGAAGSGTMTKQIELAASRGALEHDRGGGRPAVIVAGARPPALAPPARPLPPALLAAACRRCGCSPPALI